MGVALAMRAPPPRRFAPPKRFAAPPALAILRPRRDRRPAPVFMNEWNIQSRAHACTACEQPFADRQAYHTILFEERAEFHRQDLCEACWEREHGSAARDKKGFISHWQGVYEAPPKAEEVVPKENAESLLRKLIEANDPTHGPAAYILAVMLERKRLLKVKEQLKRDGQRIFIYEQPKTGDLFTITDPNLQLNQLEAVQRDVAHLLEHGFNPAATGVLPPAVPAVEPETVVAEATAPADESKSA
jgi:hypothetical protein